MMSGKRSRAFVLIQAQRERFEAAAQQWWDGLSEPEKLALNLHGTLTSAVLGDKCGVSGTTIGKILGGTGVDRKTLQKAGEAFGLEWHDDDCIPAAINVSSPPEMPA